MYGYQVKPKRTIRPNATTQTICRGPWHCFERILSRSKIRRQCHQEALRAIMRSTSPPKRPKIRPILSIPQPPADPYAVPTDCSTKPTQQWDNSHTGIPGQILSRVNQRLNLAIEDIDTLLPIETGCRVLTELPFRLSEEIDQVS